MLREQSLQRAIERAGWAGQLQSVAVHGQGNAAAVWQRLMTSVGVI